MCETSNTPLAPRTARCSALTDSYWTGISQPANGTSRAPAATWRSCSGVRRRAVGEAADIAPATYQRSCVVPGVLLGIDRPAAHGFMGGSMSPYRRLAGALICALFAVPSSAVAATPGDVHLKLAWADCAGAPGFECATAAVPRDYDSPKGAKLDIALTR